MKVWHTLTGDILELVVSEEPRCRRVKFPDGDERWIPSSVLKEIPEPDRWLDVSSECEIGEDPAFCYLSHERISRWQTTKWAKGYRLRAVQGYVQHAFIVEKKVSE